TAIGTPTLPQVSVAPNPAGEFVDISSDCPVQQVVLRDATGKAVLRQAFAETSVRISLATVPAGLYVAEISTARGTVSRKLIVE
ncbi:MAG: T9SS type A sorting domain-containing protein, partial [Bacteroidales bacterium]|nr:T9SS type A sorting domain-containing protein [Bacteroidales bacterium]